MTSQALDIAPALKAFDLHVPNPGDYWEESIESMSDLSELDDDTGDREEGEMSEDGELQETKENTLRNKKRHARQKAHRQHQQKAKAEELQTAQQQLKFVLAAIYQCHVSEIHIHNVQRNMAALKKLQDRETEKSNPLIRADVDELVPNTVWIHEPGIHLGFLSQSGQETLTVIFAVKINAWSKMESSTRADVQDTLQVVMDWGDNVYDIKNNAAQATKFTSPTSTPATHGSRGGDRAPPSTKPHGVMFGIGWHLSQEPKKSLVTYAPRDKDEKALATYEALNAKLPKVAALYRHGLACLFPGGASALQGVADREGVLSFADALDGISPQRPFANSLTATKLGFCNMQHCDNDFSPVAYGKWWEAQKHLGDAKWSFAENVDHDKTSGGEFMWGAYGIGVDFAKARGLVEIFWRGQLDYHGTLNSTDQEGYTRWGTSVQITTKGVNAMQKVWNVEQLAKSGHDVHRLAPKSASRITTAKNRIDRGRADIVRSNKGKTRS